MSKFVNAFKFELQPDRSEGSDRESSADEVI